MSVVRAYVGVTDGDWFRFLRPALVVASSHDAGADALRARVTMATFRSSSLMGFLR
jgi:hypothetical protein